MVMSHMDLPTGTLKSDLRGIETSHLNDFPFLRISLKSDLRGIETELAPTLYIGFSR